MKDLTDLHDKIGPEKLVETVRRQCVPYVADPPPEEEEEEPDLDADPDLDPETDAESRYLSNDCGRAQRFVDRFRDVVRYVPAFGRWLLWGGHHWTVDEDGGIMRLAVEHSEKMLFEAMQLRHEPERSFAIKEAVQMGNMRFVTPMLQFFQSNQHIAVSHHVLDSDPLLLGVPNGVVELRTGEFRAGRRADLITKRAGAEYVPEATCPRWEAFLDEVLAGDAELIAYIQKLVGYTLTGDISGQCLPFLYGSGRNGKSVFTETLKSLLGDYGLKAQQSLLVVCHNGREPSEEIARLHGARLVLGSETEEGTRLAESRVKDLTGGDTITGRFLYKESFNFLPRLKLWMYGNHKPEIRGADDGIWRRVRLIPFVVQIPEDRCDPHLKATLIAELPGILLWALEGTRRWLAEGLKAPRAVREASSDYRDEEDSLADFISEEIETGTKDKTDTSSMFARYQSWAEKNGVRFTLSQPTLTKRLRERGLELKKSHGQRFWVGVSLR